MPMPRIPLSMCGDYENTQMTQHAQKMSVFRMMKLDTIRAKKKKAAWLAVVHRCRRPQNQADIVSNHFDHDRTLEVRTATPFCGTRLWLPSVQR